MKKITLWLFALFTSWQLSAQVGVIENFDAGTGTPAGWTTTGGGYITTGETCSGNSYIDNLYSFSTTGTLVTPNQVAGSNGTNLTVAFDYKIENWNTNTAASPGWGNIQVQYSTNNGGAWTTFFTIDDANHVVANTCANFSNVIPAASVPNGSDVKFRFLFTWVSGDYDIYIDNFSATQVTALPPSCTVLSTPANGATNILSSTISWNNAPGIPTGYRLNVGTTPGGTNVLNMFDAGNVTNYNLGTLTAGTTYYVTVIPYNANGNATGCTESSFTTCGAVTTYPSLEPFVTFLPNQCWSQGTGGDLTAGPTSTGTTGNWYVDGLGNVGSTGAVNYNLYTTGGNDWVITPQYTIPASGYELKMIAAITNYGSTTAPTNWDAGDTVEILVSSTGLTNWTPLFTYDVTNYGSVLPAGSLNVIDLDAYSGQTVRFAIRAFEGASGRDIDFSFDNFEVRVSPTCPDQTGLTIGMITSTTADFSWDPLGTLGYQYAVTTSATPPASGTATTATFDTATGLLPQTVYYLHVRAECAGSVFGNWSTISFTTACAPVTGFNENFDTAVTPALPNCWTKLLSGATISTFASVGTVNFVSASAPNGVDMYNSNSGATDNIMLVSPMLTNLSAGTHRLKFKARNNSATQDLEIGVLTDPADATTFTLVEAVDITTTFQSYAVNFDTFSGPGSVIAIRRLSTSTYTNVYLDDIVWELLPTCPDQTGLTVSGITSTGANTSWDGVAAGVEYAITTSATPPASGTPTTALFYAASGLLPQTVYYLHVRTDCGAGSYGIWVSIPFTTQCASITTLPWIENFDAVSTPALPQCWSEESGDYTTAVAGTYNTPHSGANYLRDAWFATNEFMWTPAFDLVAGTSYDFSSWIQGDGATSWTVDFYVNSTQNSTGATQLGAPYVVPGTGPIAIQPYAQVSRTFVPATTGTYYFAFRVNEPTGGPWYVAFDDVELKLSPACPAPNASSSNITDATADLSWAAVPSAALGYEYVLDNVATDPAGSGTSTLALTYSASGLTQLTTYYFHVRSVCSAGTYSAWYTISFTTLATPPANDNLCNATALTLGTPTGNVNTLVGATSQTSEPVPACFSGGINGSVWFSFVAPASGSVEITTDFAGGTLEDGDTEIAVYAANGVTCSNLTTLGASLGCDQDSGTTVNYSSFLAQAGLTAGNTYYIQVDKYSGVASGTFGIQVTEVLSSNSFDTNNFVAYPNPVKDVLNLSYKTEISNVRVVNLLGQEVLNTKTNTNDVQVNMSALTAGAYIVNITVEDTIHTIKVIKE